MPDEKFAKVLFRKIDSLVHPISENDNPSNKEQGIKVDPTLTSTLEE
jgi:hypothetical protein